MLFFVKKIVLSIFFLIKNLVKYVGFVAFIQMQMLYPIYATVNIAIINKNGSNTNKLNSANGIPIINIDKVNSNGQSFNEYDYFDVGREGLIFNNSSGLNQTELAGWIAGNANLQEGQSASLIVNTVRSKRSELMGYMEVAGNKADVIILNSNGILCDGCGFLNTNKAVLSTGEAILNNGSLSGIRVSKGEVEIGRGGLNAENANRIDIISQNLRLNGQFRGNEVNVSLGGQDYDYSSGNSRANGFNENSNYVISSSEFGGMYGDSIRLISHNSSLGVNIDFNMVTSGSKLEVDSAGNLTISGKLSSKGDMSIHGEEIYIANTSELTSLSNINLSGSSLNFAGKLNSSLNLSVNFNNIYTLQGSSIQSIGDINIIANNYGKFEGNIAGASNILVKGGELNLLSDLTSQKNINIESNTANVASNANIASAGDMIFIVNSLDVFGKIISSKKLELNSQDIYLQNNSIVQGLNVSIESTNLDLKSGSSITSMEDFLVNLQGNFNLHEGVQFAANRDFYMKANNINLYAGANLSANGKMNLVANNLYIGIGNDVSKNDNKVTTLSSIGDLSLDVLGETNIQAKGNITSKGLLTFRTFLLNNRGFIAGQDINFKVDYLNNLGHERIGDTYNSYDNAGVIYAVNSLNIEGFNGGRAKHVLNSSSKIQTKEGDININADIFENTLTWWHIYEQIGEWNTIYENKLVWEQQNWEHEEERHRHKFKDYESLYEQDITYQLYGSAEATLFSGGKLNINADDFINRSSTISALGEMNINAKNFRNETVAKQNYTSQNITYYRYKYGESRDCPSMGPCKSWGYDSEESSIEYRGERKEVIYNNWNYLQNSLISSASDINIEVENNFNNGNIEENQTIGKGENIYYEAGSDLKEQGFDFTDIIDGNMFYLGDGTSGYLIETNPYFTDLQNFKGSAYYLNLLGLNGNDLMLGDGFVDLEAVRKQLLEQIGKELLDGYKTPEEQLEALMEAGLSAKEALGLILGQAPSQDQLKELSQPIIWWVRQEINGHSVLVPQVFFPTDYKDKNPNLGNSGSIIIGGGKVDIDVGGDANNDGTIIGEGGVSIDVGGDFNNSGIIGDKGNGEYHKEQMENIADKIEKDIEEAEKLQKEYEERAEEYKKTNDIYTSKANKYEELLAQYNKLMGTVGNKYAGKVWTGDAKVSSQLAGISGDVEELSKMMETLAKEMQPLAETLKVEGESLNAKGETLNNLSESIKKQVEDLENYVDNISGVEINVGGDFVQDGIIDANKVIVDVSGKLSSLEGVTNSTFKTVLKAEEIELIGANVSSSQLELNAKDITIVAKENKDKDGYVSELVSSNLVGGDIKLKSEGDIYISSSNIMGNSIALEAGKDITITAQSLEHKLSEEEISKEKILYTDINSKEIKEGTIEEARQKGNVQAKGFKEESVGSNIIANESLVITGENIGIYGSTLYSDGLLALDAKDSLEIGVIENIMHLDYSMSQKKSEKHGAWHSKKKTITTIKDTGSVESSTNVGSTILGGSVYLGSGGDMDIVSSVISNVEQEETEDSSNNKEEASSLTPPAESSPVESPAEEKNQLSKTKETPNSWEGIELGEIVINSGGDLSIRGAEDKRSYELSTDIQIKEISTGFNSLVDNAKNLGNAAKSLGKSMKDFSSNPTGQGYLEGINSTANLLGAVGSMGDIFTLKSSASITKTQVDYAQQESTYVGSNILGENIKISSGGDTQVKGSVISASNDVEMQSEGTTSIEAGENSFASQKSYDITNHSLEVSVGVGASTVLTGGTASVNVSYSFNKTEGVDYATAKTHTGSIISGGGNVNLASKQDINLIGSNVYGNNVATSAQNLNIESLQNEYHNWGSSTSYGFSVSIGTGVAGSDNTNGSIGVNYSESKYDSYKLVTETVAGISAKENLNIEVANNVNLKGAILEGGDKVNLQANNLNIEDLQDISKNTNSSWGVGYTYSFGKENNVLENNIGIIGLTNKIINNLDRINGYVPNSYIDIGRKSYKEVIIIKSGISKIENLNVNNINLTQIESVNTYSYSNDISDIYTDIQNNKVNIYNKYEKNYDFHIAPKGWINTLLKYPKLLKKGMTNLNNYVSFEFLCIDNYLLTDKEFSELQEKIKSTNKLEFSDKLKDLSEYEYNKYYYKIII